MRTRWLLRAWWILSALAAAVLLARAGRTGDPTTLVLGALAVVNATVGFAGTAAVARLDLLLEARGPEAAPREGAGATCKKQG